MQVTSFSVYRYKLPLAEPLVFPMRKLYRREGLLLRVASDDGKTGWGEAAPLPGFSREHLQEATRQAFKLKRMMTGRPLPASWMEADGVLDDEIDALNLCASVRYGLELAVCDLAANTQGVLLPNILTEAPRETVFVNGLLIGTTDEVLHRAQDLVDEGRRAVKLKLGQGHVDDDIDLVNAVSEVVGASGVALRLDANRAWDYDEAAAFAEGTRDAAYAYIEEPLYEPERLAEFAKAFGVPVALDESVLDLAPETLGEHAYARALVLKPSLLGGLALAMRLAREAARLGMQPVISGAYETGVGTLGLAALAASIGGEDVPVGLDTYGRLDKDILRPRLKMERGRIDVTSMMSTKRTMNGHMLREV